MTTTKLVPARLEADRLATLAPLADAARAYVAASRSDRTRDAYRSQWAAFERWAAALSLPSMPAEPETVALYLTARAQEGRKVATLAQALAAISQAHRMTGYASPRSGSVVREAFKGIRRTHGSASVQKAPVLIGQLRAMVGVLPDSLSGARDRALLLVGFAGAFRRSELVALTVADFAFSHEGVTVTLRRSKTDQEGQGCKVGLPFGSSAAMCPLRSLQAWLELAAIGEGAVFRSVDRHGNVGAALSDRDVARIVKRTARAAGLDATSLAGHSLRAGLATAAAKAGRPAHTIMKQTRHKSVAMVVRYIRDAELFSDNAAAGLL
jgi:integrase